MKNWVYYIIFVLAVTLAVAVRQVRQAYTKWETAAANMKAYDVELSSAGKKNAALQLTVSQLGYFRDSVLQELEATRKALRVKDKNIKALQQVKSGFAKADTIVLRDTLFRQPALAVDTLIGDEWYSVRLGLKYPSVIAVKPYFKSEKHIVISSKKETVSPPKRFFLLRWFQKRHRVIQVDVVERNPYVIDEGSRYVEIVR